MKNPKKTIAKNATLGRPAHTGYSSPEDFKGPYDFEKFLHRDAWGYSVIVQEDEKGKRRDQFFFSKRATRESLDNYADSQIDTYIGIHLTRSKKRGNDEVARICAAFIDIDCYNKGLSPEEAWAIIVKDYIDRVISHPSIVDGTGRGLQLFWLLSEHPKAAPRWKRVEQYLCEIFEPLGADRNAIDLARLSRLPGTMNTKPNGGMAKIIAVKDVVYTLDELIRRYNIKYYNTPFFVPKMRTTEKNKNLPATDKQVSLATRISQATGKPIPDFRSRVSTFNFIRENKHSLPGKKYNFDKQNDASINQLIINDLSTLASLRREPDCHRECLLFIVRCLACKETGDFARALQITLEINKLFGYPHKEDYVISKTASAEKRMQEGEGYRFKICTIIEKLEITEEEQQHLSVLKGSWSAEVKRLSQNEKSKAKYRARQKKQGKQPKSETVEERRKDIEDLLNAGVSRAEIRAKWKISERTLAYDLSWIKKQKNALINAEIHDTNDACTPTNAPAQKETKAQKAKSSKKAASKTHKKTSEKSSKKKSEKIQETPHWLDKTFERKAKAGAEMEKRRKEIKDLLDQGLSHAAIRSKLGISDTTLRKDIARLNEDKWDNDHAEWIPFDDQPFFNFIAQTKAMAEQGADAVQNQPDNQGQSDKNVGIPGVEEIGNLISDLPRNNIPNIPNHPYLYHRYSFTVSGWKEMQLSDLQNFHPQLLQCSPYGTTTRMRARACGGAGGETVAFDDTCGCVADCVASDGVCFRPVGKEQGEDGCASNDVLSGMQSNDSPHPSLPNAPVLADASLPLASLSADITPPPSFFQRWKICWTENGPLWEMVAE